MLRNSFKFLTLALAASLIVSPISAIDWNSVDLNSNSTRLGLGLAVVGIAYIAYKWCFSGKNTPEQKQEPKLTEVPRKQIQGNNVKRLVETHEDFITKANK